jgi:hypothetical protein
MIAADGEIDADGSLTHEISCVMRAKSWVTQPCA